jgi:diguanylate cyclase (GGDEF)-like protein
MKMDEHNSRDGSSWQSATGRWLAEQLNRADENIEASPRWISPDDVRAFERVAETGSRNVYFNAESESRFRIEQRQDNRIPRIVICAMAVIFYGTAPFWVHWVFDLPEATRELAARLCWWLIVPVHVLAGLAQVYRVTTELAEALLLLGLCLQIVLVELLRIHASRFGLHMGPILTACTPVSAFAMISLSLRRRLILFVTFIVTLLVSYLVSSDAQAGLSNPEWLGAVLIVTLSLVGSTFSKVSVRRGWAENNLLAVSAARDALTDLPNRSAFFNHAEAYLRIARRYDKTCLLALVDLDHFKKLNDHYGHSYGDDVLMRVGASLKQFSRRAGDIVARVGGEEFAVFLYDSTLEGARGRLHDLTDSICDLGIDHDENAGGIVTASVGAVMMSSTASLAVAYAAADKNLYTAKKLGRNRVILESHAIRYLMPLILEGGFL